MIFVLSGHYLLYLIFSWRHLISFLSQLEIFLLEKYLCLWEYFVVFQLKSIQKYELHSRYCFPCFRRTSCIHVNDGKSSIDFSSEKFVHTADSRFERCLESISCIEKVAYHNYSMFTNILSFRTLYFGENIFFRFYEIEHSIFCEYFFVSMFFNINLTFENR